METIYEKITADNKKNDEIIAKAVDIIKNGGLVAFPTETVYGLGGNALNPESSKKIYQAKGRPSDNPLIVHIGNIGQIDGIAEEFPEKAKALAAKFWPGPLTMVLKKKPCVPLETTGGLGTVAVRMPAHKTAKMLLSSGLYIAAPSANTSGKPSPTKGSYVYEDLNGRIDMIIEDDTVNIGVESTIIDMTREVPTLLRPGHISREDIEKVIGHIDVDETIAGIENYKKVDENTKPLAPGMMYRHYAPDASLVLVDSENKGGKSVVEHITKLALEDISNNRKTVILTTDENTDIYKKLMSEANVSDESILFTKCTDFFKTLSDISNNILIYVVSLGNRGELSSIEKNLFMGLRLCNDIGAESIYSETFDTDNQGLAVMNRLIKAAGDKIIKV